jgi:hypothetical protein
MGTVIVPVAAVRGLRADDAAVGVRKASEDLFAPKRSGPTERKFERRRTAREAAIYEVYEHGWDEGGEKNNEPSRRLQTAR